MSSALVDSFDFVLPRELEASEPPEARGLARDAVRLMVSRSSAVIEHARFSDLPSYLEAGDVMVVNASATINAAFIALRGSQKRIEPIRLHLSTPVSDRRWLVELRSITASGTLPLFNATVGERIRLPGNGATQLIAPFLGQNAAEVMRAKVGDHGGASSSEQPGRLWVADLALPCDVLSYSTRYGFPIRYGYVPRRWPLSYYQTVFAGEPGSVEMPSAGRAFTKPLLRRLEGNGVRVAPVILHAGVASLEGNEAPYPERYRVSAESARIVNQAKASGARVVAIGTTAVRALETAASRDGIVRAAAGWTDLVVTPERGVRVVDALLTGLHAPRASHLQMLEAIAGASHLARAYEAALQQRYLWHEFGDLHLILPD